MNRACIVLLTARALFAAQGSAPGMKVWAIGDYARIDPLRNKAFVDNPLLFTDSFTGNYAESNLVWDGKTRMVSLKAARNETIAFQIIVERTGDQKLSDVNVRVNDLVSASGKHIPVENIDLFKEWYVDIKKRSEQNYSLGTGWYADGLIPCLHWSGNLFPNSFILPFDIPDLLNNISLKQKSQALWVDIYVPKERKDAPPGTYNSRITVSSESGSTDLEVRLDVWDFMLPEEVILKATSIRIPRSTPSRRNWSSSITNSSGAIASRWACSGTHRA